MVGVSRAAGDRCAQESLRTRRLVKVAPRLGTRQRRRPARAVGRADDSNLRLRKKHVVWHRTALIGGWYGGRCLRPPHLSDYSILTVIRVVF